MPIYKGDRGITLHKSDCKPAQRYKGSTKIAGWESSEKTGTTLEWSDTYNDKFVSALIPGVSELKADWRSKDGLLSQVQTVQGKNLFDKNRRTQSFTLNSLGNATSSSLSDVSDYTKVSPNTNYTISGFNNGTSRIVCFYDTSKTFISYITGTNITITTPANCVYVRVTIAKTDVDTYQIELGSTATTYAPFVPNSPSTDYPSYPTANVTAGTYKIPCPWGGWWEITLTDDMRGIDTYNDRLEADLWAGKGRRRTNILKKVFDGTESIQPTTLNGYLFFYYGISGSLDLTNVIGCMSSHYTARSWNSLYNSGADNSISKSTSQIRIRHTAFSDATAYKSYLATLYSAGTPMIIYYVAATETVTNITMTHVASSSAPELSLTSMGITVQSADYPFSLVVAQGNLISKNADGTKTSQIALPALRSVGAVCDTLTYLDGNVWRHQPRIGRIASYAGEIVTTDYISTTGALTTGAEVHYILDPMPAYEDLTIGELKTYPGYTKVEQDGLVKAALTLSVRVVDKGA